MNITKLLQCKSNKDTKWYTDAFTVLINYYYGLTDISVNSKHIDILGRGLNCIINDLNRIPTETDIQIMENNINDSTSKVNSMASDFISNNTVIIYEILQNWFQQIYLIIENEKSRNSTSDKYTIESLLLDCNNNNKNTKWYTDAFTILINYFIDLTEINVNSTHINKIGQALNCIINDSNRIPTNNDIMIMDYNVKFEKNHGTTNVLRMANEFINTNKEILNDIIGYWLKYRNDANPKSYITDDIYEWDEGFYNITGHCLKLHKRRDKKWYLIAYHNLSNYKLR